MAVYTAEIQKLYVAYFNRPADFEGLAFWEGVLARTNGDLSLVSSTFANSNEYKEQVAGKSNLAIVNMIYQNLFNREPDTTGLLFWADKLNNRVFTVDQIVKIIADSASDTDAKDKTTLANKVAAATAFSAELNTASEILGYSGNAANNAAKVWLSTVGTAESLAAATQPAALAATVTAVSQVGTQAGGVTSALTKGLDVINGTSGSDTIIGGIDSDTTTAGYTANPELNTLSSVDVINGGTGIDFLKIQHASGAVNLGNLSNIEIVQIDSAAAAGVTVDSTNTTGVTELNVVKAAGVVDLTAGAATDITLAARDTTASTKLAHDIDGGKNVSVTLTDMGNALAANADTINIGGDVAAKGNVVVNVAGKQYDATVADSYFGDITVKGGTTITVNQSAAVSSTAAGADDTPGTVHQGAVDLTTDAATTTITVKQTADASGEIAEAEATGGVRETATVKFNALKTNDSIRLNGLTFTAKTDMTAAEVAAAFANLVENTLPVEGDTQSGASHTKGTYSGVFDTSAWTSAAANGDTVVFTAVPENTNVTDLNDTVDPAGPAVPMFNFTKGTVNGVVNTTTAPTFTIVQGVAQTAGTTLTGGEMAVETGVVTIDASTAGALKTVTVDGYTASNSGMTGTGSTKFDTLNLLNGGDFSVDVAAETLAVNLTKIDGAFDLNSTTTKTLNVTSNGDNTFDLDLAGASAAANLNVAGTGMLDATGSALGTVTTIKVTGTAGLDLGTTERTNVTSVDTTGTTGETTVAIKGTSSYAGGAGVDNVIVTNAGTAIGKSINLGAGNDTLDITFAGTIATPTVDLKGGDGRDTIAMSAANAVALSAATAFGAKFDGFEVLAIDRATAIGTVNMANLDNIDYVISENSGSSTPAPTKTTFTVNITGAANAGDSFQFNGGVVNVTGNMTAEELALQVGARTYTDYIVKSVSGTAVTFEARTAGAATVLPANTTGWFTDEPAATSTAAFAIAANPVQGAPAGSAAASLTINNFVNNGTLELVDTGAGAFVSIKDAATGTADVLNVIGNAAGALGTISTANTETVNVTANEDISITVTGNTSLKTVTVAGEGETVLTLGTAGNGTGATAVSAVNASAAEGALVLNLSAHNGVIVTVTGGAGDDVLTATAGTNAKADVLLGGAGADTLVAGSNGARLTGGAGSDMFVLQAGNKEANTYSIVTDFAAGDLLKLNVNAGTVVTSFAKLTATLNETTSVFSNYVDAAIAQAAVGDAVWFSFGGNSYVVVDNGTNGAAWETNVDAIIQLAGVNTLDNASFNTTYGTVGLV